MPAEPEQPAHHSTQAERDEEIAAIQQHAKHQHPGIERPPELPPAPPGKALLMVGVALLVLADRRRLHPAGAFESRAAFWPRRPSRAPCRPWPSCIRWRKSPTWNWCCPARCWPSRNRPSIARTNGYLLRWYKDIGSRVKKGELLAQIDTPEVDQELNQARAARQQMLAQMELAKITAERWENLRKTDSVSAQEADQQSSGYQQSQANLAAADANVRRLEAA